jgi:hypothetical protein
MSYTGRFTPSNPSKYRGDPTGIVYRSLWERRIMVWLDTNSNIIEWSSEEIIIPYQSPVDNKHHRYYPDFFCKTKTGSFILEVKPAKQAAPPAQPKSRRLTRKHLNEVMTWGVNEAKFKAATEFCLDKGWKFKVITEHDLGIMGI